METSDMRLYFQPLLLLLFFAMLFPDNLRADCNCSQSANGITFIGMEYIAEECPEKPFSDNKQYTYLTNPIKCQGNEILLFSHWGDTVNTPTGIVNYYVNNGYRVIRNASGTHIIVVQAGSNRFNGTVAGVDLSVASPGVYYTDPPESFNQYCTDQPLPDENNNGVPDCLDDQCPDDPNKIEPGICGCGNPETDSDGDGIVDCIDRSKQFGTPARQCR